MKPRSWGALLALIGPMQLWPADEKPGVPGIVGGEDRACTVCHPGPTRGLRQSVHADLLQRADLFGKTCSVCHGDLTAHADFASRPLERQAVHVPGVAAARCDSCHPGAGYATDRAAHPLRSARELVLQPDPVMTQVRDLEVQQQTPGIDWSGLVDFGYRFVHVAGSRQEYRSDVDLQPGLRLRAFEIQGSGRGLAVDDLWLTAHDIGDPRWDIEARVRGGERQQGWPGAFDVGGGYRRDQFYYQSGGDYHRVDRSVREARTDFDVDLQPRLRVFGAFTNRSEDGFWLTERIGNRNVTPQSFIPGVESPRRFDGDEAELGIGGETGPWHWSLAGLYRDERVVDRWTYSQPAQANPAFVESEDFTSATSLRGPGGRLTLAGDLQDTRVDLTVLAFDHDRRIAGSGTSEGFDLAQFTTDTTADGDGRAHTFQADADISFLLSEDLQLGLDARWRDHQEDLVLHQLDLTTYPTLNSTIGVATDVEQHTAQRLFEAEAVIDWSVTQDLAVGVGYGVAHEWLRVPDFDPGDPSDFVSGYSRDEGVLADLLWDIGHGWTLRAEARDFGMDGLALDALVPQSMRQSSGSLGWQDGGDRMKVFIRHRRNENPVSRYHLENLSAGLDAGVQVDEMRLSGTYTFARIDSRTLTNFYFDPDPSPVPTFVGYHGDTHTIVASLRVSPSEELSWNFTGAYTTTNGSYDVALLDWRVDLRWRVMPSAEVAGDLGLEYRRLGYSEQDASADWDAELLFAYWRSSW